MKPLTIILIAVALAMDAFSVCVSCGMIIIKPRYRHYFRLAFHFGLFQFMMPIIGYYIGMHLGSLIAGFDHWVAFGLLLVIGIKMIRESFASKPAKDLAKKDPSRGFTLVSLAVATSIDALAVGISIGMLSGPIMLPSLIIGIVCGMFSIAGIAIGNRMGPLFGKRAEAVGGIMLIGIGIKILAEHLW
jgi:putative Mn2+ efflux pump MntP